MEGLCALCHLPLGDSERQILHGEPIHRYQMHCVSLLRGELERLTRPVKWSDLENGRQYLFWSVDRWRLTHYNAFDDCLVFEQGTITRRKDAILVPVPHE